MKADFKPRPEPWWTIYAENLRLYGSAMYYVLLAVVVWEVISTIFYVVTGDYFVALMTGLVAVLLFVGQVVALNYARKQAYLAAEFLQWIDVKLAEVRELAEQSPAPEGYHVLIGQLLVDRERAVEVTKKYPLPRRRAA